MQKVKFPATAKVHFLETLQGELVSIQPVQPMCSSGEIQEFETILVLDDKLIFRIGTDQAKGLLKQLQNSIAVCETFN